MRLLPIDSFKRSILYGTAASTVLSVGLALFFLFLFVRMLVDEGADAQSGLIVVVGPMVVVFVFSVLTVVFTAACEAFRSLKYRRETKHWALHFAVSLFVVSIPILFVLAVYLR